MPADKVVAKCFRECCPFIVSVIRGEGCTLKQKAQNIYPGMDVIGISFTTFYNRLIAYHLWYAALRLALLQALTGKFNIKYLLRKFDEIFIKKLTESRFCSFANIFLNCESDIFGYNRYFLENLKC